jgi:hypothetical protein
MLSGPTYFPSAAGYGRPVCMGDKLVGCGIAETQRHAGVTAAVDKLSPANKTACINAYISHSIPLICTRISTIELLFRVKIYTIATGWVSVLQDFLAPIVQYSTPLQIQSLSPAKIYPFNRSGYTTPVRAEALALTLALALA